jgi:hypothetical protein
MPDFGGAYAWLKPEGVPLHEGVGGNVDGSNLGISESKALSKNLISDIENWQAEFESFDDNQKYGWLAFDWPDFHRRGITLTARIKDVVGNAAIVIYEKAFEDPCHHDAEQREVFAEGTYKILPSKWRQQKAS